MTIKYSGRTTAHEHKFDNWREKVITNPNPAIKQVTVFDVQWSDCPVEVEAEVKQLWRDNELSNDNSYYSWNEKEDSETYPIIAEYLKSKGVTDCLINWWW
jgi:hypothetical protein